MNKSTVYRALERLEEDGVLHSFIGTTGIKWYAKCVSCDHCQHFDNHPHFECLDCGKVECLNISIGEPKLNDYQIVSSRVLLQGKCNTCIK